MEYRWSILLPPLQIVLRSPAVTSYLVLVFGLVQAVGQPQDFISVRIAIHVHEVPLAMLETGQPQDLAIRLCNHFLVGSQTV